jgi:hypothetical protein
MSRRLNEEEFMGGTNSQAIAELKVQNDRLMAAQVILRNQLKAQGDKYEQNRAVDQMTSAVNTGLKAVSDKVVKDCNRWLDQQHFWWQNAVHDTRAACFLTSEMYNDVMSAEPKPSVFEAVVKGLITGLMVLQPEFAMVGVVLELGMTGGRRAAKQKARKAE